MRKFADQGDDNDCAHQQWIGEALAPRSGATIVSNSSLPSWHGLGTLLSSLVIFASLAATGCQMDIAGQTLPSPYYLSDDVQYYAPGPEFKLAREAATLKEQSANQISEPQR